LNACLFSAKTFYFIRGRRIRSSIFWGLKNLPYLNISEGNADILESVLFMESKAPFHHPQKLRDSASPQRINLDLKNTF